MTIEGFLNKIKLDQSQIASCLLCHGLNDPQWKNQAGLNPKYIVLQVKFITNTIFKYTYLYKLILLNKFEQSISFQFPNFVFKEGMHLIAKKYELTTKTTTTQSLLQATAKHN